MGRKKSLGRKEIVPAVLGVLFLSIVGLSSTFAQTSDVENIARNAKDKESNLSNVRREVSDIKRETKGAVDTSKINAILSQYEACINELKTCPSTVTDGNYQVCWDKNQDCDDMFRTEDEMNDNLRPARDCVNYRKNIDDRRKEKKNLDRQVKDILRQDKAADVSGLNATISQIDAQFSKVDQAGTACSSDIRDTLNDVQSELNGLFSDFYSSSNEVSQKANEAQQLNNSGKNVKEKERQLKDLQRELKNQTKRLGEGNELVTQLAKHAADYQAAIERMRQCVTAQDVECANDENTNADDASRNFWDTNNEAGQQAQVVEQKKNLERSSKDFERNLKQMDSEYKRVSKQAGRDIPEMKAVLEEYRQKLSEVKRCEPSVEDDCNQYFMDMSDIQQRFWELNQTKGQIGNYARPMKDFGREWKDRARDVERFEKEAKRGGQDFGGDTISTLRNIVTQAQGLLKEAEGISATGENGERLEEIFNLELQDLRMQFEDERSAVEDQRQGQFQLFEFKNLSAQIEDAKNRLDSFVSRGKLTEAQADTCRDFGNKAQELVSQILANPEKSEELGSQLEGMGESLPRECEEVFEGVGEGPVHVGEFVDEFGLEGLNEDRLQKVMDRISEDLVNKVLERVASQLSESVVQKLLSQAQGELEGRISSLLEYTSGQFVPEQYANELVENKANFVDLVKRFNETSSRPGCEGLGQIKAKIEAANLVGESASELQEQVEGFLNQQAGLSGNTCKNVVNALSKQVDETLTRGQEEAYEKKVIPFKDTGADQYYAGAVAELAQRGIVSGKKDASGQSLGVFDPAAKVKVTEMLRMIFEASGAGKAGNAPALCGGKFASHWAAGYIAQAENAGLGIVSGCSDLNRDATRGEVVQMILEAASIVPTGGDYAAYAQKIGLIKGGPDGNLRLNDGINRAEAATVVKRALSLFAQGGEQ